MIDIIYLILMGFALWKGYSKGFIVALFSFAAIFIGLAAALKLSTSVALWLQTSTNIGAMWMPFLSFILVMAVTTFIVYWAAKIIEKALKIAMLGWANKIAGIILFMVLYTTVYSVMLFYINGFGLLKPETLQSSQCYGFIAPWAPKAMELLGNIVPVFKNMFSQLQEFFGHFESKA